MTNPPNREPNDGNDPQDSRLGLQEIQQLIQSHAERSVITITLSIADDDCGLPCCYECNDVGALGG